MTERIWRKSIRSATEVNCVEVARFGERRGVRDSKQRERGYLALDARVFAALVGALKGR